MNKKFSTLAVSLLLTSAFSAYAEDVKVTDASQLVNGAKYKIAAVTEKGDSIVVEGKQNSPINDETGTKDAPTVAEKAGENLAEWTLTKVEGGFQLKASEYPIRTGEGGALFTVSGKNAATLAFNPEDSVLTIGSDTVSVHYTGLSTQGTGSNKFVFTLVKNDVTTIEGSTELSEISGAVYVVDAEGKYVGVSDETALRSSDDLQTISADEFASLEDKRAFVWVETAKGLKSAYAEEAIYLVHPTF